jgi:hypothetical protein
MEAPGAHVVVASVKLTRTLDEKQALTDSTCALSQQAAIP